MCSYARSSGSHVCGNEIPGEIEGNEEESGQQGDEDIDHHPR